MTLKELLDNVDRLNKITHDFDINGDLLTLQYYLIFETITARIDFKDNVYRFDVKINDLDDISIDLSEEKALVDLIGQELFNKIINKIFKEQI